MGGSTHRRGRNYVNRIRKPLALLLLDALRRGGLQVGRCWRSQKIGKSPLLRGGPCWVRWAKAYLPVMDGDDGDQAGHGWMAVWSLRLATRVPVAAQVPAVGSDSSARASSGAGEPMPRLTRVAQGADRQTRA